MVLVALGKPGLMLGVREISVAAVLVVSLQGRILGKLNFMSLVLDFLDGGGYRHTGSLFSKLASGEESKF